MLRWYKILISRKNLILHYHQEDAEVHKPFILLINFKFLKMTHNICYVLYVMFV
jgi:hypothetical protein